MDLKAELQDLLVKVVRRTLGPLMIVLVLFVLVYLSAGDEVRDSVIKAIFFQTWPGLAVWSVVIIALIAEVYSARQRTKQMALCDGKTEKELEAYKALFGDKPHTNVNAKDS